jgi:alkanesulfonate monooxygenase SsuD/methylene tetrahydromethanopterin reductase-like flavin-dependent oxidoreductase (luciferase family)
VKLGVLLPTFRNGSDDALAFAGEAARQGIDGVFAYDHLWPMGSPERPALSPFPVLSAIAAKHEGLIVAPLVARVGLVGTEHLVSQFRTLNALAPGRVIAGLGTGDRLSADENEAYGLASLSGAERRELMIDAATELLDEMPVWFGGGSDATNQLAIDLGAELNLWNVQVHEVEKMSEFAAVNWAGNPPADTHGFLDGLEASGATWAIFAPSVQIHDLKEWREGHPVSKFR